MTEFAFENADSEEYEDNEEIEPEVVIEAKRYERQKIADENRELRELKRVDMIAEINLLLNGLKETCNVNEKERDRQMANLNSKMMENKILKKDDSVLNNIMENYQDLLMAYK